MNDPITPEDRYALIVKPAIQRVRAYVESSYGDDAGRDAALIALDRIEAAVGAGAMHRVIEQVRTAPGG